MRSRQIDLAGKAVKTPEKPWAGICSKGCWFAKGERCTCRCHKANHGKGHHKPTEEEAKQQQKLKDAVKELKDAGMTE